MPQPQMTVLEILNRTKVFFEKKGIPDARLDAEYIISYGLKMKNRMDLYLNFEKPLTPAELDVLRTMVARRATREPLQHIIGDTSFRGFIIKCDRRALIPRPETESLVDMAADSLKGVEKPFIVEIGTGTGAISIACAKEIAGAKVLRGKRRIFDRFHRFGILGKHFDIRTGRLAECRLRRRYRKCRRRRLHQNRLPDCKPPLHSRQRKGQAPARSRKVRPGTRIVWRCRRP